MFKIYKEVDPTISIMNMRKILSNMGINVIETLWENPFKDIFSCKLEIVNTKFAVFGKGITPEYCLASAYGELLEEIQTGIMFIDKFWSQKSKEIYNFIFDPYEVVFESKDIKELPESFKNSYIFFNSKVSLFEYWRENFINNSNKFICLPFTNIINNEIVYLPLGIISMINGTNGICSGNSYEEALIHGFSEIFERYVTKKIFLEKSSIPIISKQQLKTKFKKVYELIKQVEDENKYKVIVKDCTFNNTFPVMGIILINNITNKYVVNLGADPDLEVALHRCLTEVFQGGEEFQNSKSNNLILENDFNIIEEYNKQIKNGSGKWPKEFLISLDESDIKIIKFDSINNKFDYLINKFKKLGINNIYIRDCTYSLINSYQIVIPGLSEAFLFKEDYKYYNLDKLETIINIKKINLNELEELALKIEEHLYNKFYGTHNFVQDFINIYFDDNFWDEISLECLLFMIYFKLEMIDNALLWLKKYISLVEKNNMVKTEIFELFKCIYYILNLKNIYNLSIDEINNILLNFFDKDILSDSIEFTNKNDLLFEYLPSLNCFNCKNCKYKNCKYENMEEIYLKVKKFKNDFKCKELI